MSKDKEMAESLREHLSGPLALPDDAANWLLMLWNAIQVFDDVADGDEVGRKSLDCAIWDTLVGMNQNPFWTQCSTHLAAALSVMIMKWQASDHAERNGQRNEVSFVWRAGFYDVVLLVVLLVHGSEKAAKLAPVVMQMYGEKFSDYVKEFDHA